MDTGTVAVVNPLFCAPYPIDLAFTSKSPNFVRRGGLTAVDSAGKVLFRAKDSFLGGFTQLQDAAGHTLLTMKAKRMSVHGRWQAFAGDGTEAPDLLFSVKKSSYLQFHEEWVVYLAANTKEDECDFKIKGSYRKKNFTIYRGDSSSVVAQLTKKHKLNVLPKSHAFGATISPNCDYSFITALIAIFRMVYSGNGNVEGAVIGSAVDVGTSNMFRS
ncbi:Protein LURP-one-related 15 [Platanthera zijinensis]|uniref:Protein LURP-one-related 15 n=1 Tax=Platanthera zijinensis TaxID=2320716 RepID=A0AAP0C0V9_9ASPA